MKKIAALISVLLVCCSCAKKDPALAIAQAYSGDVTCTYAVQAFSEPACDYTLAFSRVQGTDSVEVLAPKSVAGIKATVEEGSAGISFDGKYLEAMLPYYWGLSPVDCMSALFDCMASGPPLWYNTQGDELVCEYRTSSDNADIRRRVTLDKTTLALKSAEVELDGAVVMTVFVSSLQVFGGE